MSLLHEKLTAHSNVPLLPSSPISSGSPCVAFTFACWHMCDKAFACCLANVNRSQGKVEKRKRTRTGMIINDRFPVLFWHLAVLSFSFMLEDVKLKVHLSWRRHLNSCRGSYTVKQPWKQGVHGVPSPPNPQHSVRLSVVLFW